MKKSKPKEVIMTEESKKINQGDMLHEAGKDW